jgi:hypothetical protein
MSNDWGGTGYDSVPEPSTGIYFRLTSKGQTARLRLVSEPYLFVDHLPDGKPLNKAAWIAILKEMVDGKPSKRVVIFQAGPMVLYSVRDLARSEEWGDPTQYDLQITRTEEAGKYYTVLPMPKPMGPISADEQALVDTAAIDLKAACTKKKDNGGNGHADTYDPFESE